MLNLSATLSALVELQKQRVFCIKSQSRSDRSCEAFIARYLGYRNDLPEKERTAIFKRAAAMRRAVEKGGRTGGDNHAGDAPADGEGHISDDNRRSSALSVCTPIILNSATSRAAWDSHRNQTERQMRKLARSLPIWSWVEAVAGFGDLGLAIVVAEAGGDLANYATKERLWKRLGLAVIEGERQQRKAGAEMAAAHGYSPRRRAEIWTLADSMFRHQWRGEKEGVAAHPAGPYGEVYAKRKAHTATREWTLGHRENDARRVMTKALIEDLWKEWRA